jgi:DNA repair exonuclease SbcCD ATPase subunit
LKILSCHLENFASYKQLDFEFDGQGLALIHGATGSGKSTLCDAIPWVLFGKTAKGGNADEVLSWNGGQAKGFITLEINNKKYVIMRSRKPNDLYYCEDELYADAIRGKDLTDTQRIINNLLGITYELYLSGAYFHEFSQTAQFFTTTPKNRRTICEQITDLTLAKSIQDKAAIQVKEITAELVDVKVKITKLTVEITTLQEVLSETERDLVNWYEFQDTQRSRLQKRRDSFDKAQSEKLNSLHTSINSAYDSYIDPEIYQKEIIGIQYDMPSETEKCITCGVPYNNIKRQELKDRITALEYKVYDSKKLLEKIRDLESQIENLSNSENPFILELKKLEEQKSPSSAQIDSLKDQISMKSALLQKLKDQEDELTLAEADLELLLEVIADFRGTVVKNTLIYLQDRTNELLSSYFDAEIKVELDIEDADKLEVSITKDGNQCAYTQLSKGQRQLLKLCFGVSVMKTIANHHAVRFEQIFLDEALDGLDENFKIKALRMLETIALDYGSVFLVEHSSEIKAAIDKKYRVELINGASQIIEE